MNILIDSYKDNEEIPKRLALCFVDISVRFSFNENWYNEKERDRLEDAANELSYLAEKLFAQKLKKTEIHIKFYNLG